MKIKTNTVFMRILIPLICVIIIQTLISYVTIMANGTISKIESNSVSLLNKNVENRQNMLQNMMMKNWSYMAECYNLTHKETAQFLSENNMTAADLLHNPMYHKDYIARVADILLDMQRTNVSNGTFFILSNGLESEYENSDMEFDGVYFRDFDTLSNPADYSDIMLEKGAAQISSKYNIALDSFWREKFYYSPTNTDNHLMDAYFNPYFAAEKRPALSVKDLGYWNVPSYLEDVNNKDSNQFISYSIPLICDGVIVGVIGSEIQVDVLTGYFPAKDMGNTGGGYLLVKYDKSEMISDDDNIDCTILVATGSRIKLLRNTGDNITLYNDSKETGLYKINPNKYVGNDLYAAIKPLQLYNSYTPFGNDYWALVCADTDIALFGDAVTMKRNILLSSLLGFVISLICVYIVTSFTTKPMSRMVKEINTHEYSNIPIKIEKSNIHEIDEIASTINIMSEKQTLTETKLREERERYLIALESCSDTILEYTISNDTLEIFHFRDDVVPAEVYSEIIVNYKQKIHNGEICHPDDRSVMLDLFSGKFENETQYRLYDGESHNMKFIWVSVKVKCVFDNEGYLIRIIGSMHDITEQKNKELSEREAVHHDAVTGLYTRDFGEKIISKYIYSVNPATNSYCMCVIDLNKFHLLEEKHGHMFCNVILAEVGRLIKLVCGENDVTMRVGGNEFLLFLTDTFPEQAVSKMEQLNEMIKNIYVGEGSKLTASIGIVSEKNGRNYVELLEKVMRTVRYVKIQNSKAVALYSDFSKYNINIQSPKYEPYSFSIIAKIQDYDEDNIVNFALNIFDKSTDIRSSINIILIKIARSMPIKRILITESDKDFNTTRVVYQWNAEGVELTTSDLLRSTSSAYNELQSHALPDNTFHYNTKTLKECSLGMRYLLRNPDCNQVSGFGAAMYSSGVFVGAALFEADDPNYTWSKAESDALREVTKIFSTHISRSKSDLASKAKSDFLSRMSHEIRTPMNAIIGMTDIALSVYEHDDSERVKDCLNNIEVSSKYLLSLINDVLDMSRIESGKMKIVNDTINLNDIMDSIDIVMRPQAEKKNINFIVNTKIRDNIVLGDEFHLNQVLINLLSNAIKFTDTNGTVTVSIVQAMHENKNATVRFSVKDTGIGIRKEETTRIFKAFEQANDSTAGKFGGTGLGLAISSSIVQLMGSRLEVTSEAGVGSEFFFTIEFRIGETKEHTLQVNSVSSRTDYTDYFKGKRVLVVEDNELNTEIAVCILELAGFEVDTAENGKVGFEKFKSSAPYYYDAILMDIRMPIMDGLEATRAIRKCKTRVDATTTPIVAMTANAFDEDMKKSINSGMNGHVAKPIDTLHLYNLLDTLIFGESVE